MPVAFPGIPMLVLGIRFIWTGRRGLQALNEPKLNVQGTIISAYPRFDWFSAGRYSSIYTELELDDDTTLIFRIPGKLAHRVPLGARVRVECLPANEVVTNVTLLEPEGEVDVDT